MAHRRGNDSQRHHLSRAQRHARDRQGARPFPTMCWTASRVSSPSGDFPHTLGFEAADGHGRASDGASARRHRLPRSFHAIYGLPRHLGQHSGGMIIFARAGSIPSSRWKTPRMPGRVVAQWDKDDCEDLGIIKVDFLGLGMMSVLAGRDRADRAGAGIPWIWRNMPQDDPATFEMIRQADTIGVFQIESRAQMATLPRMKPESFYDVVIEVAIIRPGPIQGDLTHPYLARRAGKEQVTYYRRARCDRRARTHARRAAFPGANAQDRHGAGRISPARRRMNCGGPSGFHRSGGADGANPA